MPSVKNPSWAIQQLSLKQINKISDKNSDFSSGSIPMEKTIGNLDVVVSL
jgi:hypothetical protein